MTSKVTALGLIALLSAICFTSAATAQTSWERTYGWSGDEYGSSVQQTNDGGYMVVGETWSSGTGNFYLVKTNAHGDMLWSRVYSGPEDCAGLSGQQTNDGGYVMAGYVRHFGSGFKHVYLVKTNATGDTLWTRIYDCTNYDWGNSVRQTTDNGYVIAGSSSDDFYLMKTNAQGDTLWARTYGGTDYDEASSVRQTTDGGYIIAGTTASFGAGYCDVYVVKTDASGETLWTRTHGGAEDDFGCSAQQTTDGGYIVVGFTGSSGAGAVFLIRTNAYGDTVWTRTYGTGDGCAYSVQQTTDGGFIVVGEDYGVYAIKTNAQGDTLWTRTYGGAGSDVGRSVQQTTDGGYIIAGHTNSFGAGGDDVYLIKTDSLGNVGVAEESSKPPAISRKLGATILSGASGARHLASSVVFDAMGRRVLHPRPGIYFVREEPQASSHKPQAAQKVLLVR